MKNETSHGSGRSSIMNASLVAPGLFIVSRHISGKDFNAPGNKLNIGGICLGGKRGSDLEGFAKSTPLNIIALCDVNDRPVVKSRQRFPKIKNYNNFRRMLDQEEEPIDAVSIATPYHTHAAAAFNTTVKKTIALVPESHYVHWVEGCMAGYGKKYPVLPLNMQVL